MKRRQVTAILLSAIMTVSSCMPMNGISAFAAENTGAGSTETAAVVEPVTEEQVEEFEKESVETQENSAEEKVEEPAEKSVEEKADGQVEEKAEEPAEETSEKSSGDKSVESTEMEAAASTDDEEAVERNAEETVKGEDVKDNSSAESQTEVQAESRTESQTESQAGDQLEEPAEIKETEATVQTEMPEQVEENTEKVAESQTVKKSEKADGEEQSLTVKEDAYFSQDVDNHLVAYPKGAVGESVKMLTVDEGSEQTLIVEVDMDYKEGCSYYWAKYSSESKSFEKLDNPSEDPYTYVVASAGIGEIYKFHVTDYYENKKEVFFYINFNSFDNELNLYIMDEVGRIQNSVDCYIYDFNEKVLSADVSAKITDGISYQWYYKADSETEGNGSLIEGATEREYTIDVKSSNISKSGIYTLVASDIFGNSDSVEYNITIYNNLTANINESWKSLNAGEDFTLSVSVSADNQDGITYQWYLGDYREIMEVGSAIAGATSQEYKIDHTDKENYKAGKYTCIVTDRFGNNVSRQCTVSINNNLNVYPAGGEENEQSAEYTVSYGEGKTLGADVTAIDTEGITYQWYDEDGKAIDGQTGKTYDVASVTELMKITCTVTDRFGNSGDVEFLLRVRNEWVAYPDGTKPGCTDIEYPAIIGETVTLKVNVYAKNESIDIDNMTYKWHMQPYNVAEDVNLDSDGKECTIENYSLDDCGYYLCDISDCYNNSITLQFYVPVESGLKGLPSSDHQGVQLGDDYTIYVEKGDSVTLKADASIKYGNSKFRYVWSDMDGDITLQSGNDITQITIDNVTSCNYISCTIYDDYDNQVILFYNILVQNNFNAYPEGYEGCDTQYIYGKPGTKVRMHAVAEADESDGITYEWAIVTEYDYENLEVYEDTMEVDADKVDYACRIVDKYGNIRYVYFKVRVDNGFEAYPEGAGTDENGAYLNEITLNRKLGGEVDLNVVATADSGELHYFWSKQAKYSKTWGEDEYIYEDLEESTARLSTTVTESATYRCIVSDDYKNEREIFFRIKTGFVPISMAAISLDSSDYTYDGTAKTPAVTVEYGDELLVNDTDYTLAYSNNVNAGTATVTITGKDKYIGSETKEFTITKAVQSMTAGISSEQVMAGETADITMSGVKESAELTYSSSDEAVATVDTAGVVTAKGAGTATITVTAAETANYNAASTQVTVTVLPYVPKTIEIGKTDITLATTSYTYDGTAKTPAVTVGYGDELLVNDTDYTLAYSNNTNAGTASAVITGIGNYTGSVTKTFAINKAANSITAKNFTKTYSKKAQSFAIGARAKVGKLTYKSNSKKVTVSKTGKVTVKAKFIGKATITLTASGNKNYNATTKKITVTVNPTKSTLSSVKNSASKKMTVKWKKNTVGSGYQIQYGLKKNFKGAKTVTISKNSATSRTISNLKKGKTYYVRIRTYKKVGSVKYYSAWSAVKKVRIKK